MNLRRATAVSLASLLAILPCETASAQQAASGMRTWTSADGRVMQAKLTGVEGDSAVFQMQNGSTSKVPLARLSQADRDFIAANPPPAPAPLGRNNKAVIAANVPLEKRVWPKDIVVPPKSIDVKLVEDKPSEKIYRYRSQAFEFVSQDKLAGSVMTEVARIFEGTRELVDALPWGVHPEPAADLGFFQAKLYVTVDDYHKDGGPPNSGGVYMGRDRIFRVPFRSIGLVMRGKTWFKDEKFSSDTLVHEITHQMMHDYLPFLPHWIAEGTAEYTNMLPYNAGTFHAGSHERGIKEYIKKQLGVASKGLSELGSASEHVNMTPEVWATMFASGSQAQHRIYGCSCLLVYYFCHLDGDGKGTRFLKFFDALAAETARWKDYSVQFAKYRYAMDDFFTKPGVKKLDGGKFTYPKELTPPAPPQPPSSKDRAAFGAEQVALLMDGRSPAQFDEDVRAGFKKIGIKW